MSDIQPYLYENVAYDDLINNPSDYLDGIVCFENYTIEAIQEYRNNFKNMDFNVVIAAEKNQSNVVILYYPGPITGIRNYDKADIYGLFLDTSNYVDDSKNIISFLMCYGSYMEK